MMASRSSKKRHTNANYEPEDSIDLMIQNKKENVDFKKRSIYNEAQVKQALGAIL